MPEFGLIGNPVEHSESPRLFREHFKKSGLRHEYGLFALDDINQLKELLQNKPEIRGLNVTSPFKTAVIDFCKWLDKTAEESTSVNTLKILRPGRDIELAGYNTDYYGFLKSAYPHIPPGSKALILGNGGVSKTVQSVFSKLNIDFIIVTRNPVRKNEISYSEISYHHINEHNIIINTTTLGMYPETTNKPPIPYSALKKKHFIYDLIYKPEETEFLKEARKAGAKTKNGIEMLQLQAQKSWEIWSS